MSFWRQKCHILPTCKPLHNNSKDKPTSSENALRTSKSWAPSMHHHRRICWQGVAVSKIWKKSWIFQSTNRVRRQSQMRGCLPIGVSLTNSPQLCQPTSIPRLRRSPRGMKIQHLNNCKRRTKPVSFYRRRANTWSSCSKKQAKINKLSLSSCRCWRGTKRNRLSPLTVLWSDYSTS